MVRRSTMKRSLRRHREFGLVIITLDQYEEKEQ